MAQNNNGQSPIFFNDVQSGLRNNELVFRLIHFWEARNPNKGGLLIGLELLFIDEQGTVIQGFIAANRIARYQRLLNCNAIYRLINFFTTKNKLMFSVTEHEFILCFTDLTTLIQVGDTDFSIDVQRFRFHSFSEFDTQADMRGPLYGLCRKRTKREYDCQAIEEPSLLQVEKLAVFQKIKDKMERNHE